jgi:phage gpG-like protein
VEIRVEGAKELRRKLRAVQQDLPKAMKQIHEEVARPIVSAARQRARRQSGRMAGTIRSRATTTMARVEAGRGIEYGAVQHWGGYHNISPDLYLTETINERTAETLNLYEQGINDFLRGEGLI